MTVQDKAEELLHKLFNEGQANVENVNSGTAVTVSTPDNFTTTVLTLNGATPAITMPAPANVGQRKRLYLVQDATGSRVPTWAGATINWLSGAAPVLSTTPAAVDRVDFESIDGTTWEASTTLENAGLVPAFSSPGLATGTAKQDTTGEWSTWYISITGGTAGTVEVKIGPDNTTADDIIPLVAANAVASQVIAVRLPPKWWIKATVVTAAIAGATQVTG